MKKAIILLAAMGIIGADVGFYLFNKKPASLTNAKSDISISSTDLLNQYESNEEIANQKYLDKVILVQGTVSKIDKRVDNTKIYLMTENDLSSVICQLETTEATLPKKGDNIKIKGICTGYLMDVVLIRSVIQK